MNHKLQEQPKTTRQQFKELIKSWLVRFLQILLFWLPVKKNRIMVYVHARRGFTCNPKYIVKKIIELYGTEPEIIWTSMYPETCQELSELGITVLAANSRDHIKAYFRTRVYITNDAFPSWAYHRNNQLWINTWHGAINYKHIGYGCLPAMSWCERKLFRIENRRADCYISGSKFFTEDTSASFSLNPGLFWATGLPRNDLFFQKNIGLKNRIRNNLNISDNCKIVLYAPTFREKQRDYACYDLNVDLLLETLHKRFDGRWLLLLRNHYFVKGHRQISDSILDVSFYPDMQELLLIADVLVSDYSSCMWDFCLTGRPCFAFTDDLDYYANSDRGFALPPDKWPFTLADSNKQLAENILSYDPQIYGRNVMTHLHAMGSYDRGTASLQIAQKIGRFCQFVTERNYYS